MQHSATALASGMTLSGKLLRILDRSLLPAEAKKPLRASLEVLLDDLEDWHPDRASFDGMIDFVAHHTAWVDPALSITTEGFFKLMWEIPGSQWILDFLPSGQIQWTHLTRDQDGLIARKEGRAHPAAIPVPFEVPLRHQRS